MKEKEYSDEPLTDSEMTELYGSFGEHATKHLENKFTEAEGVLETLGREEAKKCLPFIYDRLIVLNKRDKIDWENTWVWNPNGYLTREEFDRLNRRRELLSNAIGIMTASGVVRHDLNKI